MQLIRRTMLVYNWVEIWSRYPVRAVLPTMPLPSKDIILIFALPLQYTRPL